MKVLELMNPRSVTVGSKTPLHKILRLMLRYHLNDVVVVDSEQKLGGTVTYSDLSHKLLPTHNELMEHEEYLTSLLAMEDRFTDITDLPVDEIMTSNVITASPDDETLHAGAIMTGRHVKQLPVVQNHKVIGIISPKDIGWGLMMQCAECRKSS
jgi:CBS domain-containing protein